MKSDSASAPAEVEDEDAAVAAEGLGKNFRDTPWSEPSKDIALQHGKASVYESGKASVWGTGPKQLGGLGEGISLYFYILKFLSLYFFVASVLAIPHMLFSWSGNALDEQVVGQTSPLIKLTAINHADPALLEKEEDEKEEPIDTEVKHCLSTYYNLDAYSCDELETYASQRDLTLLVPHNDGFKFNITMTLAMLDCDLGCGCNFDLTLQKGETSYAWTDQNTDDESVIKTCKDYYVGMNVASTREVPPCPVASSYAGSCGSVSCGDQILVEGADWFYEQTTDCNCLCANSALDCGEYNPSMENLNLAPFYNSTVTRDDASLLITLCDILYSLFFIILWKYMSRKVAVVVRQTDDDNVTAGDYTVVVSGLPPTATEEEVRRHFSDIYQLSEPDWTFPGYMCGLFGKKRARLPEECLNYDLTPLQGLEPVRDVSCHGKENYIGSWVADVNIAHPNGKLIRRCQALKKYSNRLLEARAKVKKYSKGTPLKNGDNPKKLKNAEINLALLEEKIAKIHTSLQSSAASFNQIDNECLYAFVTFENEDSYIRCLEDYTRYSTRSLIRPWTWFVPSQPPMLRFYGEHHLTVKESPEPSNIMWENLETSYVSGLVRKAFTATVTIAMLVISLALVIIVKAVKANVEQAVPDLGKCTGALPAIFNVPSAETRYVWFEKWDDMCEPGSNFITIDTFFYDMDAGIGEGTLSDDSSEDFVRRIVDDYKGTCQDPCISEGTEKVTCVGYNGHEVKGDTRFERLSSWSPHVDGLQTPHEPIYFPFDLCPTVEDTSEWADCQPISSFKKEIEESEDYIGKEVDGWLNDESVLACEEDLDPSWVMSSGQAQKNCVQVQKQTMKGCFCLNKMIDSIAEHGVTDGAQKLYEDYAGVCGDFAKQYVLAQTLVIGSAAMVTVINVLLKVVIKGMAAFEHHKSLSNETKAVSSQIAITMFVNTAIIIMVVHAAIEFSPLNALGMLNGDADDFDFHWYVNVGSAIILTMAINSVTVHISPILGYYVIQPVKLCLTGVSATQRSLNKKMEGPEFEISTRFPMILNTLAVTMVFSSALPVLLPIAFVACQFFFHVDKLLLLRYFKKPPAYDAKLASGTVHLLPFVLLVHCAFATWVYSAKEVFQSTCIPIESFDYEEYLETAGDYDNLNVLPRILRRNVFPMFLVTMLLFTLIVYEYLGSTIVNALLKGTVGTALKVVFAPFKKLWQCCCGHVKLVDKEFNPPFTKDFVRGYAKSDHPPSLSQKAGWELEEDEDGFKVHRKKWIDTGEIAGKRHQEGDMKKTWEAIRDTQVHTYSIRNNPIYTDAMIAKDELIRALKLNADNDEFEGGGTDQPASSGGNKVVPVS